MVDFNGRAGIERDGIENMLDPLGGEIIYIEKKKLIDFSVYKNL